MYGWSGTILRVDLSEEKIRKESTAEYVKDYFGGALIGLKLLWDEVPAETKWFDPKNVVIINTGPLTGTLFGNKVTWMSRSAHRSNYPVGFVGMGGHFPSEIKFAGYDHILIKGKAKEPVYLYIDNESVEIRDAKHIWGLDTFETQLKIKEELKDPDVQVACIGPAGENMVVYASIIHELCFSASRRVGAVMGSKKLKAIAVRGTKGVRVANPEMVRELWGEFWKEIKEGQAKYWARLLHAEGISRQFMDGYLLMAGVKVQPMGEDVLKKYKVGSYGCAACPIMCMQRFSVPSVGNGASYCTLYAAFPTERMYRRTDFSTWWERTLLVNKYGIDCHALEVIGGWLMELYKRGLITTKDTDGVPMIYGDKNAVKTIIEKVCKKEGFGALFAEGIVSAAEKTGWPLELADQFDNSDPYAWVDLALDEGPVAKYRTGDLTRLPFFGDAFANVFPFKILFGMGEREALSLIEGWISKACERILGDKDFWRARPAKYDERVARLVVFQEDEFILGDLTGHCDVVTTWLEHYGVPFGFEYYVRWLNAVCGENYDIEKLRYFAQKTRVFVDAYNALCYATLGQRPIVAKPLDQIKVIMPFPSWQLSEVFMIRPANREDQKKVSRDYCALRGYDPETGIPTRETLEKFGLKDVADTLEAALTEADKDLLKWTPYEYATDAK
jgi:aldehyde:ferredoxin oxidoreductase